MRTLIREGIEAFIVEESRLLFLGLEVFSLWDSTLSNPKRDGQTFPCRVGFFIKADLLELSLCGHSDFPRIPSDFKRAHQVFQVMLSPGPFLNVGP